MCVRAKSRVGVGVAESVLGAQDVPPSELPTRWPPSAVAGAGSPPACPPGHTWANHCPNPLVVTRLPWSGSGENTHGPNGTDPDRDRHAAVLDCHRPVVVGPSVNRRARLVLVGPITSADAARSIRRTRPSRSSRRSAANSPRRASRVGPFRSDGGSCRSRSLTESRRRVVQNRITGGEVTTRGMRESSQRGRGKIRWASSSALPQACDGLVTTAWNQSNKPKDGELAERRRPWVKRAGRLEGAPYPC